MTWDEQRHATCEAGGIACDCYPCRLAATERHEDRIRAEARREALRDAMRAVRDARATSVLGESEWHGAERQKQADLDAIEALMAKEGTDVPADSERP